MNFFDFHIFSFFEKLVVAYFFLGHPVDCVPIGYSAISRVNHTCEKYSLCVIKLQVKNINLCVRISTVKKFSSATLNSISCMLVGKLYYVTIYKINFKRVLQKN